MPGTGTLGLLGIPFGGGQRWPGVEAAPRWLRATGLVDAISRTGWKVDDSGDLVLPKPSPDEVRGAKPSGPFRNVSFVADTCSATAFSVERCLSRGKFALQLGGDHGVALGSIAGALRVFPDLRVIWVDAHGDINTPQTSPSGNFHGMPVAALLNLFPIRKYPGFEWLQEVLRPERIALVGVRDLDPGERKSIDSTGVLVYSTEDVHQRGAESVIGECMRRLDPGGNAPFYYSLDIDALDPKAAGATGAPVQNGLTVSEAEEIGRSLAASHRLKGMDLVELNPLCGDAALRDKTLQAAIRLVVASLDPSSRVLDEAS